MTTNSKQHTLELLRAMLNAQADFRPGQWEAIEAVAIHKKRALVVQRTGWGKSLVYFLATKLLHRPEDCPGMGSSLFSLDAYWV